MIEQLNKYCVFLRTHIEKFSELLTVAKKSKTISNENLEDIHDKLARCNAHFLELEETFMKLTQKKIPKDDIEMSSTGSIQVPTVAPPDKKIQNMMLMNALSYMNKMTGGEDEKKT